jgi:MFS family permease
MFNRNVQVLIVIATSILNLISTDILLPSLPQIAYEFAVPANEVKMLISIFLIGQFVTALMWGVIADQIGKSRTLLLGMFVFLIGSVLSLFGHSINFLLVCRFLQGAGGIVVPVAGWALVQDLFHKDDGARIMSWIGTLGAVIPLFAPAIGGKIDVLYGWHANLSCIAICSTSLCIIMLFAPKHLEPPRVNTLTLRARLSIYARIMKNKKFISYISLFGLLNCGEWCFITMAPFYYAQKNMAPDQTGILLMLTSMGFMVGSLLASHMFKRIGVDKTIAFGIQLALIISLMLLLGEYLNWNSHPLVSAIELGFYILSSALLWGGTTSRALQCFDDYRSSASAVRSLILLCFAAIGTYSGQLVSHEHFYHVSFFLFFMSLFALFVFNGKELKSGRLSAEAVF